MPAPSANKKETPSSQHSSHPTSRKQPPIPAPAKQNSESVFRPRQSARLNPGMDQACAIKSPPGTLAPQSRPPTKMARTYPLSLGYNQCLGAKEDPFSFSSLCLEDLRNGDLEYLVTIEQLVDALQRRRPGIPLRSPWPRHPSWPRAALPLHASCPLVVAAVGWEFRRASHALHFCLARQGRRVVLRGVI